MIIEAGTNEARAVATVHVNGELTKNCLRVDVALGRVEVVVTDPATGMKLLCDGGSAWQTMYVFGTVEVTLKPGWFFNEKREMIYLGEQQNDENKPAPEEGADQATS